MTLGGQRLKGTICQHLGSPDEVSVREAPPLLPIGKYPPPLWAQAHWPCTQVRWANPSVLCLRRWAQLWALCSSWSEPDPSPSNLCCRTTGCCLLARSCNDKQKAENKHFCLNSKSDDEESWGITTFIASRELQGCFLLREEESPTWHLFEFRCVA